MNTLDLILIIAFAIFGIIGLIRGLIKQVGSLLAWIVGFALAMVFFKTAGEFVHGLSFFQSLDVKVLAWMNNKNAAFTTAVDLVNSDNFGSMLETLGIPEFLQNMFLGDFQATKPEGITVAEYMAPLVVNLICNLVGFIGCMVIGAILTKIVCRILSKMISKVPVVGKLDKILGLVFGVLRVVIYVSILFSSISFLVTLPKIGDLIQGLIDNYVLSSKICKWIYDNNPLFLILSWLESSGLR